MSLFTTQGILLYTVSYGKGYKLIVSIDEEISNYYRSLLPKTFKCQQQRYPAHISVVRNETPTNLLSWGVFEKTKIEIQYDPDIQYDETYYWLDCYSKNLETIRHTLGLPLWSKTNCPPNLKHCFHITIGNRKNV